AVPGEDGDLLAVHGEDQCDREVDASQPHRYVHQVGQAPVTAAIGLGNEQAEKTGPAHLGQCLNRETSLLVGLPGMFARHLASRPDRVAEFVDHSAPPSKVAVARIRLSWDTSTTSPPSTTTSRGSGCPRNPSR